MKYLLILFFLPFYAFSKIPELTSPVMDEAKVISNSLELEKKIREVYNNGVGPQINILTINSLNGVSIEEYANQVFRTWKLGDAKRDDGVLFLIVINDRKMRIEVGQGLEGGLTDAESKRILSSLKDYFRNKDYSGGITHGLNQIINHVTKPNAVQDLPKENKHVENSVVNDVLLAVAGTFILLILLGRIISGHQYNVEKKFILKEEEARLDSVTKQILDLEKNYNKPIDKIIKEVSLKNKEIETEIDENFKEYSNLKLKALNSQSMQYQNKQNELNQLEKEKEDILEKINYYKQILISSNKGS